MQRSLSIKQRSDIGQMNPAFGEHNLQSLLTVMRRMHVAARDHQWTEVDQLDQKRCEILNDVHLALDVSDSTSRAALAEIIELDQEVIKEIHRGMDLAALMTDPDTGKFSQL